MKNKRLIVVLLLFGIVCLRIVDLDTSKAQDNQYFPSESKELSLRGRSLSLEECIRFALANSFEVKLARLDFLIAETDLGSAESIFDTVLSADINYEEDKRERLSVFGATHSQTNIYSAEATKEFPSGTELTLSLSDTRNWDNSGYTSQNPAHTTELELELRQPLARNIFGYIDRRNISVTGLAIQNADLNTKERIERLLSDVEVAYWQWAFAKRSLQIHQQILQQAKDLHQANARNYDIGRIERGDFLASGANVLIREKDVLVADNQYRRAEETIKLLMNITAAERLKPRQTLQYKEIELKLEDCLQIAFQKRRDYQSSKRELEIKNIVLETKANARWPEIDLVASMTANGISPKFSNATRELSSDHNRRYYAGLEISIPIENNLARSEFKQAEHNKEKAIITLKSIERAIVTEIGNAFRDYITHQANLNNLTEAARLQQEKLQEEEKRFKYGRSNTKRLIDYQQDYLKSQLEVAQGMLNLEVARINLDKALNIILEKYASLL